ncbi:MAG: Rpn family recombination-promoting nuclease/putative transposase [Microcoleus sp. PH2017_10_PVI_O_A]|uniref:Rpn family recombination-promoting nuclease/putative transposase n=1 Tax=unclassified Microcoleus TaxID=2642155 RepID=UPI001D468F47|nr:Rpn family recombination-promoting nuclease/putative transposase [Microcoleus sp. PH2017_21_RUC_O_A]MCC3405696.1 Rpn family recombination-promoting nuclease/putative transposase [Microcoleus sp. PH2017_10_PVI_O_A]MCC3460853.1 Rpn family recombination-promoting nuclease/putative transposase [Microcoleus sp. PH2017_11_PCY_U_A]MCC3478161.1 Rpn family recombination-promoting nuclease/putative transposase [Microcoleus sp. PH2017_12_PCY_D_A]MCC3539435.1 Rpn family recombination-promoting nuclease/
MKTDSIFYNIFQEFPFVFFALLGISADSANQYQFTSQEIKQLAFRLDGLFLPIVPDPQLPFYIVEVQFQPDPTLYYRLFAELFIYLKQYQPPHPWQLVVIYPNRQTERESNIHFQEMLALPKITRIYIDELSASETASLPIKVLKLVIEPDNTAENFAIDLARQAETEISDSTVRENFINLLETIILYKLPQKTREEIAAMLSLSDLKKTRVYQEIFEEVQAEAEAKIQVEKQRQKVAIFRLFSRGLATEDIAKAFDLPLAEVAATIAEAQKEQAEQAEQN